MTPQERWDRRFLEHARLVSTWSKDPSTRVGAVLADPDHRVISTGYNGFPRRVADTDARLLNRETKLKLTIHAEANAILFAQRGLSGCTCYVYPMPPCAQCASLLIQTGVSRVVACRASEAQESRWGADLELTREIFREAEAVLEEVEFE